MVKSGDDTRSGNSRIPRAKSRIPTIKTRIPKTKNTPNFSGVLGAAAPKGLGRSPYEICELDLSSLKASKNLEFLE